MYTGDSIQSSFKCKAQKWFMIVPLAMGDWNVWWKVLCWSRFSSEFREFTSNFPRPSCLGLDSFNPVSPFVHSSNCHKLSQNSRPVYVVFVVESGVPIKRGGTGLLVNRHTTTSDTYLSITDLTHLCTGRWWQRTTTRKGPAKFVVGWRPCVPPWPLVPLPYPSKAMSHDRSILIRWSFSPIKRACAFSLPGSFYSYRAIIPLYLPRGV